MTTTTRKKTTGAKKPAVTTGKLSKTKLAGFAPKPGIVARPSEPRADPAETPAVDAAAPVGIGPRGGRTANLADRAVAISFRVSKEQYRKLCEARLDANTTTQGLMLLALGKYFQTERRSAF